MARPIKKLSREVRVQVEQRIHAGDVSYTWIAASFNISKERVSQIAKPWPRATEPTRRPRDGDAKIALIALGLLATTGVVYAACMFC